MKIAGPINQVILRGSPFGNQMQIEIFLDIHLEELSRKCSEYTFIDYLNAHPEKNDIYLEDFLDDNNVENIMKYDSKYINQIRKNIKNIPRHNIHNIDIRKILSEGYIHGFTCDLKIYVDSSPKYSINTLNTIYDMLIILSNKIETLHKIIATNNFKDNILYRLIFDLKNNFENIEVKTYVLDQLSRIIPYFIKLQSGIRSTMEKVATQKSLTNIKDDDLYEYKGKYNYFITIKDIIANDFNKEVKDEISKIHLINKYINIVLMDVYLIKTLLSKKSSFSIIYAGADHCINYIITLVNKFKFDITSPEGIKTEDIKKADFQKVKKIFFPPKLVQCVDV